MIKEKFKLLLTLVIAGTLTCCVVLLWAKKPVQQDEDVKIVVVPGAVDNYTPDSKMKKNRKNSIYKTKPPKDYLTDGSFLELTTGALYEDAAVQPARQADKGKGKAADLTLARAQVLATAEIPPRALILYDAPEGQAFQKFGLIYAIMLENLLGHFKADVELMPIGNYDTGMVEDYDTTFYLGAYYDNPVPQSFMNDVMTTQKTIVWFKYNIWQLAWNGNYNFNGQFGFSFSGLRSLNQDPSEGEPNPGFFDTVLYRGLVFEKYYDFDASSGTVMADPDVGVTQVIDPAKAEVLVPIENSVTSEKAPYIIRSNNFWYIGDMPFSFIGPRDRYLVICDILHDILQVQHPENNRAMVRLEDVSPIEDVNNLEKLTDYLRKQKIPFSIAVIPVYLDPLGHYNGGEPVEIHLSDAYDLQASLQYATQRGGDILMHGYTHQYDSTLNPYTGVTADDFEFWDIVDNAPVTEEGPSTEWARGRIQAGLNEFQAVGIQPFIFETPHYIASPNSYQAMGQLFAGRYERSYYFTSDDPRLDAAIDDPGRDFGAGQFFPYIIHSDHYGQIVLPENLGNIEYDIREIDPLSYIDYGWKELKTNAEYALTVRDGYASFFFHPFWLERDLGVRGFRDFKNLVNAITRLGYSWVDAKTEFEQINSN